MAFHKALILATTLVCCASAFPDFMFPGLQTLKRDVFKGRLSAKVKKGLHERGLTVEQKCDKLTNAFQGLIDSVHGNMQDAQIQMMKDQLIQTTGVDITNPQHVREESCALASIDSIADFAERAGIPESYMREFYPSFVDSINMVRNMLRDTVDQPYLPAESREILRACLTFYDTLDEIGLLSLD